METPSFEKCCDYFYEAYLAHNTSRIKEFFENWDNVEFTKKQYPMIEVSYDNRKEVAFLYRNRMLHPPICKNDDCGKYVKYNRSFYPETCGYNCSAVINYKNNREKIKKTNIDKYGVEHFSHTDEFKEKVKKTSIGKYGAEHYSKTDTFKDRVKKTAKEKYGVDHPMQSDEIKEKVKKTNIEKYGTEKPQTLDITKQKAIESNFKKYGVDHPMYSEEFKENIRNTNLEKYGVEYPLQSEIFKNKSKDTNFSKYGVEFYSQTDEFKNRIKNTNIENYGFEYPQRSHYNLEYINLFEDQELFNKLLNEHGTYGLARLVNCDITTIYNVSKKLSVDLPKRSRSIIEDRIEEFLIENDISYIIGTRRILPSGKELDFYFPEYKIAIEFNGTYWHTEIHGNKDRNYHYNKWKECDELGITLLSISEDEYKNNKEFWFNKILYMTKKLNIKKIHARKCEIKELKNITDFLNKHHLQGSNNSKYKLGLYYNDDLVSVMAFTNTRDNKSRTIELSRFCNHSDYIVSGGASKLLNYFIDKYGDMYDSIISFSDNNYSNGNVYKALGFDMIKVIPADYKYVSITNFIKRMHKSNFRKSNIFEKFDIPDSMKNATEWELMQYLGYDRIWDSGKKKWLLTL